jgi:hypothetical protein
MPTLADIYSAINSAKRKGADFVQNPVTSLQQMVGNANDRARVYNQEMNLAAQGFGAPARGQQPTPEQLAAQQSTMDTFAEAYNPVGMTVFHGSPHLFERFSMGKIGTGEGNQAYGRGLYMAQNPEVAKSYAVDVADNTGKRTFAPKSNVNQDALDYFQKMLEGKVPRDIKDNAAVSDDYIKSQMQQLSNQLPSLYKVDLPDTHIRRMLDFDSPLKNQPKPVRNLAKSLGMDLNDLGGDLLAKVGKGDEGKLILQNAGIPGVKYLDQTSRNASGWHITPPDRTVSGKWMVKSSDYNSKGMHFDTEEQAKQAMKEQTAQATRNFVVFDDKHLKILERNSQPIK